jgi:hypothetical protein
MMSKIIVRPRNVEVRDFHASPYHAAPKPTL